MKDARGHGSNARGGPVASQTAPVPAHQAGVQTVPTAKLATTAEDAKALRNYQVGGRGAMNYQTINDVMRGRFAAPENASKGLKTYYEKTAADSRNVANKVNDILSRSPLSSDMTVYRGVHPNSEFLSGISTHPEKFVGKTIPAVGFQSTSSNPHQSIVRGGGSRTVLMEVHVPKGSHAVPFSGVKGMNDVQQEVLLGEGNYKVRSATGGHIVADYVEGSRRKF